MSGGAFEYRQNQIDFIIEGIEDHLESMGKEREDVNDPYGRDYYSNYPEERTYPVESEAVQQRMRRAIRALKIAKIYAQRVDWYLSGDDGEENFLKRLDEELDNLFAEPKKCKYVKREGESCTLNDNCTYPNCKE
jgi:hypothetical protein